MPLSPSPSPTAVPPLIQPEREYLAHLAQGRLMLLRSRQTGAVFFYPRVAEPMTGSRDLEWVPACGLGVVHASTVVRPKPPQAAYNVALIELAEGPRLLSRVEGLAPEAVHIGLAVRARIIQPDGHDSSQPGGQPLLVFDPAANAGEYSGAADTAAAAGGPA